MEERFFAEQLRRRSAIRIREGREQAIDLLAKNVLVVESGVHDDPDQAAGGASRATHHIDPLDPALDVSVKEPWQVLEDLLLDELKETGVRLREMQKAEDLAAQHDAQASAEAADKTAAAASASGTGAGAHRSSRASSSAPS